MLKTIFLEKINNNLKRSTGNISGLTSTIDKLSFNLNSSAKFTFENMIHIFQIIERMKPKNVILFNNVLEEKDYILLKKKYSKINFYTMIHANIPFLVHVGKQIKESYQMKNYGWEVIFNDERTRNAFGFGVYLPNVYGEFKPDINILEVKDKLKIICAGALRPFKNHVTQAIASIKYANELNIPLEFTINYRGGMWDSGAVLPVLRDIFSCNPKHKLIAIPQVAQSKFVKNLENYHMGLQLSLSESFNMVSADYVNAGIPMVVSDEVRWACRQTQASAHDVEDIVSKMKTAHLYIDENKRLLKNFSDNAKKMWNEYFS